MKDNLILNEEEKEIQLEELMKIVQRNRKPRTCSFIRSNSVYQYRATIDDNIKQQQYTMQIIPGSKKQATKSKRNMTLAQMIFDKENRLIKWSNIDLRKDRLVVDKFGLAVPMLLNDIIFCIGVMLFIVFLNSYSIATSISPIFSNNEGTTIGCSGICLYDFENKQISFLTLLSFFTWQGLSYILKIKSASHKEKDEDVSVRKAQAVNQNEELLIQFFPPGLNKQEIEQLLFLILLECYKRLKIGTNAPLPKIILKEVKQVADTFDIKKMYKKLNCQYMKLVKAIYEYDHKIISKQKKNKINKQSLPLGDISKQNIKDNEEDTQFQEQEVSNETNNFNINNEKEQRIDEIQKINLNQLDKSINEEENNNQNSNPNSSEIKKVSIEFVYKNQKTINQQCQNEDAEKVDLENGQLKEDEKKEELNEIKEAQYGDKEDNKSNKVRFNNIIEEIQDKYENISIEQEEIDYPTRIETLLKEKKVRETLQKYIKLKSQIQNISIPSSTNYIIKCSNAPQYNLLQIILHNQGFFIDYFEMLNFIYSGKTSFPFGKVQSSKTSSFDIRWKAIGIQQSSKLEIEVLIRLCGIIQFSSASFLLIYLDSKKTNNDNNSASKSENFYYFELKVLFVVFNSLFYLINEKIYEIVSKKMATSLKSKQIKIQTQDLFFYYSFSYVLSPLINLFIYGITNWIYSLGFNNPSFETNLVFSPFHLFITNSIVAVVIFSVKSWFSPKYIFKLVKQAYWKHKQRYHKLTQYETNKIFKRKKYSLKDSHIAFGNVIIVSIPLTYCRPAFLLLPIVLLSISYFVYKFQYIELFRPCYFNKSVYKSLTNKLSRYIQFSNFISFILFCQSPLILSICMVTLILIYIFELVLYAYQRQNQFNPFEPTPFALLQALESISKLQDEDSMNQKLQQAIISFSKT